MRRLVAAVAGVGAVAAAFAALGLVIARRLTEPPAGRVYDLTIRDMVRVGDDIAVVLDRNSRTSASGIYNLWLEGGGWVKLGPVVDEQLATVIRTVVAEVGSPGLLVGQRASWSGVYYRDPADAGLPAEEISISTSAGLAPAWLIRPARSVSDTWAVHLHGLGSLRAGTLRGAEVATELGLTSLVVTYRNDGEGPTVGKGRSTLGAVETDDARAAMRYARDRGARRIVLFGWSMGAAIALQLASDAEFHGVVDALVLDSPVLDWTATINANCARAGLPSWFGLFARPWLLSPALARFVGLEKSIPLDRFNWVARAPELSVPTLVLHGVEDTSAPFAVASRLAELRPDVVCLESFKADHTMAWNSDPERWRAVVREWLAGRGMRS